MPLLDHFHPPLNAQRHWESFHATWATAIADALNADWLPDGYFAEERSFSEPANANSSISVEQVDSYGGQTAAYKPAFPMWSVPGNVFRGAEVLILKKEAGPTPTGAVEMIAGDAENATMAAVRCATYISQSIGVVLVDLSGHVHAELMSLYNLGPAYILPGSVHAVGYRPARYEGNDFLEIWPSTLAVDQPLPELPLWIGPNLVVPINLESTYDSARRRRRLP